MPQYYNKLNAETYQEPLTNRILKICSFNHGMYPVYKIQIKFQKAKEKKSEFHIYSS